MVGDWGMLAGLLPFAELGGPAAGSPGHRGDSRLSDEDTGQAVTESWGRVRQSCPVLSL